MYSEPAATQTWDSCIYSGEEEALFARDFLKPALVKAGLTDVKISVWDHNKEKILERAEESLSVDGANDVIDGVAFHWYTGDHFEILSETIKRFPDKEFIFTEGCVEYSRFSQNADLSHAQMYAHDMIGDLKAGANAFLDWNVILDAKGGPNHVGNYCGAPLMCDTDEDRIDIKPSYYYIRHFSHFIRPGAKRFLTSSYNRKLETVGFSNPDGSKVVIVLNESDEDLPFTLCDQDTQADFMMKANSIITILM